MSSILQNLLNSITGAIKMARPPFPQLPAVLLLCDIQNRAGLSAINAASAVIAKLPDIGIPNSVNADGSENLINKYTALIVQEIVNEIKTNGISMNAIPVGGLNLSGTVNPTTGMIDVTNTNVVTSRGGLA